MKIFSLFLLLAACAAVNAAPAKHAAPAASHAIAINAGGPRVGRFAADMYVVGGYAVQNNKTGKVNVKGVSNPAPAAVYFTERWGEMAYTIPGLRAGASYKVRLHESEDWQTGPGKRLFNVSINGAPVLKKFDIFAAAGAMHKAVVKDFVTKAFPGGRIVIRFSNAGVDNAKVDGIEVIPMGK